MSRRKIDWSELYPELLISISDRLQTRDDVRHFRSVCTKWRCSILQIPHNLPILSPNFPRNFSISKTKPLTIVANTTFLFQNPNPNHNSKPWLITVEELIPGKLFLRKPLVRTAIKGFPSALDLSRLRVREIRKDYNLRILGGGSIPIDSKVVLFFNPDSGFGTSVRDCYALVLHDQGNLFFARLSDEDDCGYLRYSHASRFDDIVNYKGVIWAIDRKGRAYVIRYDRNHLRLRRFANDGVCSGYAGDTRKRLIESGEGLYLIVRYHYDELIKFRVYKLNEGEQKWSEVKNLDGRVIFVSSDCCFFGSAEYFPACEGNCILFPKDHFPSYSHISTYPDYFYFKGADKVLEIGVFHLDDGESGLISTFPGFSDIFWPPPWWLFSDTCPSGRRPGQENDEDGSKVCEEMCSASLANETDVQAIGSPSTIISHEQCEGLNVSWSDIPSKLLTEIANHLKTRMDISRFRSVCKKWRTSFPPHESSSLLSSLLPHKISTTVAPFLDRTYETPHSESFHSLILVVSTVYLLRPSDQSIGPSKSWLVTVEELNQGRLFLRLPLRRAAIQQLPNDFPRVLNLSGIRVSEVSREYNFRYPNDNWHMFRSDNWWSFSISHKVVLSHGNSYTSPAIDDTTALVLYKGNLTTFRLRDERSSSIRCGATSMFDDIISSNGKIFVIDRKGRAYVFNRNSSTLSRVVDHPLGSGHGPDRQKRLVESDGELYVVVRHSPDDQIFFQVYKMNERQNKWDEVKSLGDKILFVTHSFCFVASSQDLPGWKGNCVVFPEDCLPANSGSTGRDWIFFRRTIKELRIAVFYLGDNDGAKLIKTYPGYADLFWPPPSWLQLARCSSSSNKEMQIDLPCKPSDGGEISPDLLGQTAEEGQNLENSFTSVKQEDEAKSETTPVVTSRVQSSDTGIVPTVEFQGVQVRPEFLPVLHKI